MPVNTKQTWQAIRATGAHVRRDGAEWRVNVPGGTEANAYYTPDPEDALATARCVMAAHRGGSHA